NLVSSVTSRTATLTVLPDTNAPVLLEADGTRSLTEVLVLFSERISLTDATNRNNYKITNTTSGVALTITSAVLTNNATNVLLTTSARTLGSNYILVVNNIHDAS